MVITEARHFQAVGDSAASFFSQGLYQGVGIIMGNNYRIFSDQLRLDLGLKLGSALGT